MKELTKALDIALNGPIKDHALEEFHHQLQTWGLAMPPVEPLVLDFGIGSFATTGLIEYWIANEESAGYCGKFLYVSNGQTCPKHHHRCKLETFFIVQGQVEMEYNGQISIMEPGQTLRVEVNHPHRFTGIGPALLLEVSKPCLIDDNYFADSRIPIGGNYKPL